MEFFRFRRDIPFMRFALTFNVISLVTFVLAVVFLIARGLNLGVDFRGGTVIEVVYGHAVDFNRVRGAIDTLGAGRLFGAEFRPLRYRADPPAAEGRRIERAALGARHGRAARRRPVGDAAARRVRRPAGRQGALRERRARAAAGLARHRRATSRCASSGGSPSRRSSPTCTTSSSFSGSSPCSSGSSRCRCWRRCSRCWAIRSTSRS